MRWPAFCRRASSRKRPPRLWRIARLLAVVSGLVKWVVIEAGRRRPAIQGKALEGAVGGQLWFADRPGGDQGHVTSASLLSPAGAIAARSRTRRFHSLIPAS